jgi:predicted transcriptional regulator
MPLEKKSALSALLEAIARGEQAIAEGRTFTQDEAKKRSQPSNLNPQT